LQLLYLGDFLSGVEWRFDLLVYEVVEFGEGVARVDPFVRGANDELLFPRHDNLRTP
jgi:hypothetical protein